MRGSEDLLGAHHGLPLGPAQIFDLSFLLLAASLFALYHCWCARRAVQGVGVVWAQEWLACANSPRLQVKLTSSVTH